MSISSIHNSLVRTAVLVAALGLAISACGDGGGGEKPSKPRDTAAQTQWKTYAKAVAGPAVKLDWRDRPDAPAGFTGKDMDTFAKAEVALIEKSISPEVADMAPDDAQDFVLSGLLSRTRDNYLANVPKSPKGKHAWEWYVASMYKAEVSEPTKVIRVDWDTNTTMGTLDNGERAPYLSLTLQVFFVHTFGPKDHPRPVVVRRAVQLSGYQPNGGPAWWPSLITSTTPFGNDGCALAEDSTLRPLRGAKYLKADFKNLRKALDTKGVSPLTGKITKPNRDAAQKFAAFCAAHPNGA